MTAPTPGQQIPNLNEEIAVGTGKMSRGYKLRQTSGTESGSLLLDFEILHQITTIDQAREVETWLPGAVESFQRAFGENSDGGRSPEWKPAKPDCTFILCAAGGGEKAFEGAAEAKRAVLRIVPKACVLTVYFRLHSVEEDDLAGLARLLGEGVDYERTKTTLSGPTTTDQGPLFKGKGDVLEPAIGDLVVGPEGDEVLRVTAVAADGSVTGSLLLDGSDVRTVPKDGIFGVHRLCGTKGGPPDNAIRKLRQKAEDAGIPDLSAADLQAALIQAVDQGLVTEGPSGYALSPDLLELTIEVARDRRLPPEV